MWILGFAGETEVLLSSTYNGGIYPHKQGKELLSILCLNIICLVFSKIVTLFSRPNLR